MQLPMLNNLSSKYVSQKDLTLLSGILKDNETSSQVNNQNLMNRIKKPTILIDPRFISKQGEIQSATIRNR